MPPPLPFLTSELPGTGGHLRAADEDFEVREIAAYEAEGEGDHVFVTIEKRGLTTPQAAEQLARALGVGVRDVGWAGMKDRRAVTVQTLSLPPPVSPEAVRALDLGDAVRVLAARRHRHKLRTGHLRGNRFRVVIRDTDTSAADAAARAEAVLACLARPPGSPNWFGEQRFGARGDNAERGRALITGDGGGGPRGRKRRLLISAYQSRLFNELLARRIADGLYRRVLAGDILQKRGSGGVFTCEDPATDQARLDAGELAITGPMYGHKLMSPPAGSDAGARERALLDEEGITLEDFRRAGKLATGARRPFAVDLGEVAVEGVAERAIAVSFGLPPGAYATAVMREITKAPGAKAKD